MRSVFRVKLMLPSDYPHAPPKGFFLTKIFHPNISKAGEICVNTLKKDWSSDLGIGHVLQARAPAYPPPCPPSCAMISKRKSESPNRHWRLCGFPTLLLSALTRARFLARRTARSPQLTTARARRRDS